MKNNRINLRPAVGGAAALLLLLTGCGSADEPASSSGDGDTGADVGQPGLRAPQPVRSGSNQGDRAAESSVAADSPAGDASERDMAELSMMAPWRSLRFELGGSLTLPTADTGYVYDGVVAPDFDAVLRLAAALGVEGQVTDVPADEGGGWRVGPGDGTAPTLQIAANGQLDWWFNPAWTESDRAADCVVFAEEGEAEAADLAEASGATDTEAGGDAATTADEDVEVEVLPIDPECDYEEPEPPANVPDEATALQRAAEILAAAGIDVADLAVETYADEWQSSVYYSATDSLAPPRYTSIGFGGEGVVSWASGQLGVPEAAGPYPLIEAQAAVDRMNEMFGFTADEFSSDDPAVSGPAVEDQAVDETAGEDEAGDLVADELPIPVDMPEAIDHVVTVVSVEAGLWSAWDEDGSVWYVPAYEFQGDDGGIWTVPAVTDDYLIIDEQFDGAVMPGEPLPEPAIDPDGAAVSGPAEPGVDDGAVGGLAPEILQEDAEILVGLTQAEAEDTASANGWTTRVAGVDGEPYMLTEDYVPTRVNLILVDGVVTEVWVG